MEKLKTLELFKGGGSFSKIMEEEGHECITLDILEKYKPTICCDIMDFDYKQFEPGYFDIIWASCECKIYSQLQYTHINTGKSTRKLKWDSKEQLEEARKRDSKFINRTIEIIEYLKPKKYFIENPLCSAIWKYVENKEFLEKFVICDYCRFGYDYKKPTKILTNKLLENKRCLCKKHNMRLGITGKNIKNGLTDNMIKDNTTLNQRYSIPQKLLDYLFN